MLPDGFVESNKSKFAKEGDKERRETSLLFIYCLKKAGNHIQVFGALSHRLYYEVDEVKNTFEQQ